MMKVIEMTSRMYSDRYYIKWNIIDFDTKDRDINGPLTFIGKKIDSEGKENNIHIINFEYTDEEIISCFTPLYKKKIAEILLEFRIELRNINIDLILEE